MADVDVEPPAAEAAPTFVTETPASAVPDEAPAKQTGAPKAVVKAVLPKAGIKLVHDLALEPQELDREAPYAQYTTTHAKYAAAIAALRQGQYLPFELVRKKEWTRVRCGLLWHASK